MKKVSEAQQIQIIHDILKDSLGIDFKMPKHIQSINYAKRRKMKIYAFPGYYEFSDKWPTEYVWLDSDSPLDSYTPKKHDIDKEEYLCEVHWGEYMRISYKRRYLMHFVEFKDLNEFFEFFKTCYENGEWFTVGYRSGVIQVDPWD